MSAKKIFALVDCNNFFVSCERIFRPDLEGKPVAVLSSNDGCVVARSDETKALGIPMGAPAFKYKYLFDQNHITKFSGNFELYGDISRRITTLLATISPYIEVYSVDESFLDISTLPIATRDYTNWGHDMCRLIQHDIGVPVSVGIASSKTLAKMASEIAKHHNDYNGTFSFIGLSSTDKDKVLSSVRVGDIWGIGRHLAPRLKAEGIFTALDLSKMRPKVAKHLMGIHGQQLIGELNGNSCLGLGAEHDSSKSIMRSRTFGEDTNQAHVLESALASLAAQAAFKLRQENLLARQIGFFVSTSKHKPGYRRWTRELVLDMPTCETGNIISRLITELNGVFSPSQQYHRLGVFMNGLVTESMVQTDILGLVDISKGSRDQSRMKALDYINNKWGKNKLHYAAENLSKAWQPKREIRSPLYVSSWDDLPEAHLY